MKKLVLMIIPALICGLMLTSCGSDKAEQTEQDTLKVGEITEIKLGETVNNFQYGLSLRIETLNDSRCPTGAICVWQGVASVQLHLTTKKGEHDFTLNKFGLEQGPSCEGIVVEGIKYYLIDVLPYPVGGEEQPLKIVKILVEKLH